MTEPERIELDLQAFFPYQLSILYDEVSHCVSQVYAERFNLPRQQWQVLAVLGGEADLTATEIGARTHLDKMQVSRAVGQLEQKGHLERSIDPNDKRNQRLRLTAVGRRLYTEIVPHVRARENYILSSLTSAEQRQLDGIMAKLLERSRELQAYG